MRRFFINQPLKVGKICRLDGDLAHHIGRVLRMKKGENCVLFNGFGKNYTTQLSSSTKDNVLEVVVLKESGSVKESSVQMVVAASMSKNDKFDFVIQKATELGVLVIYPLLTAHSEHVGDLDDLKIGRKLEHFYKIAVSAAEQCGRATVPIIFPPIKLSQWLLCAQNKLPTIVNLKQVQKFYDYPGLADILADTSKFSLNSSNYPILNCMKETKKITNIVFDTDASKACSLNSLLTESNKYSLLHLVFGPEGIFTSTYENIF